MSSDARSHIRPVRYPLRSADQIFFMHIPKTGGTTVINVFQRYFSKDEYFSVLMDDGTTGERLEALNTARLIRAHRTYSFQKYFVRRPVVVTFLRDPVARLISSYSHRVRENGRGLKVSDGLGTGERIQTIEEFAQRANFRNIQTQYLSGIRINSAQEAEDKAELMLDLAKAHLEWIAYFGILERFDESMRLLSYTFSWPSVRQVSAQNTAPPDSKLSLSPEALKVIQGANELDQALYDHCCTVFEERLALMQQGL